MTATRKQETLKKLDFFESHFKNAYENIINLVDGMFDKSLTDAAENYFVNSTGNFTMYKLPTKNKFAYAKFAGIKYFPTNEYYLVDSESDNIYGVVFCVDRNGYVRNRVNYMTFEKLAEVVMEFGFISNKVRGN